MRPARVDGTAAGAPLPSRVAGRRPVVLVVEDDLDCRTIFRTILEVSGYSVLEASSGSEGLHLAATRNPDIVLMDLGVPDINGWIATRMLGEHAETATIPVIAVTGHVLPEDEALARAAGCVSFIAKPVEPKAVVSEIRRILSPPLPSN